MENFELPKEKVDKVKEEASGGQQLHQGEFDTVAGKLKRDHDSLDDFEHLEHESSPVHELLGQDAGIRTQQVQDIFAQLVDVPRAVGETHPKSSIDKHDYPETQRSLLDSSLPAAERDLLPAPATPPPSADFVKRTLDDVLDKPIHDVADILGEINAAQAPKPFQTFQPALVSQVDPKAASLDFMESERSREPYQPRSGSNFNQDKKPLDSPNSQGKLFGEDLFTSDKVSGIAGDLTSGLQRALEAQVAEAKTTTVKKSESVEEVFEDLAQAALKMPEVQDMIDPKEDLFSLDDAEDNFKGAVSKDLDRNLFDQKQHDSYVQLNKSPPATMTQENSAKLLAELDFDGGDLKLPPKTDDQDFFDEIKSSVLPAPQKSPEIDFLQDEPTHHRDTKEHANHEQQPLWSVEKPEKFEKRDSPEKLEERELTPEPPTKALPPIPRDATPEPISSGTPEPFEIVAGKGAPSATEKYEFSSDFIANEIGSGQNKFHQAGAETGDSEFESEPESSCPFVPPTSRLTQPEPSAKTEPKKQEKSSPSAAGMCYRKDPIEEIAPKEIFREMGLVEALIYWRDPKKSGIVFGAILGVLLSLAYFSLISVLAYVSLITLTGTVAFRVYKTVLQAVQKTSDGHPFKDVLDIDLTVPAEKVHDVADVAVAHANAAIAELRRLFLVEDLVDSIKFGVLLWCLTYLGAWFNGMTLIIIGVVALFSLPKVYETNKTQIDQNVDLVRGKINELTAKVKAAIPLGKKAEPTKEE
ncbi:reticulon-1 isoform X2 [Athalia rosae]|uniref:reticulon-1 isoform X2 n=1 Tax=Athalia rosae TaxID=37344 RepID=UPI00203343AB|nr:reticulon-1 isoform X2 [Athalia rosae]